MLSVGLVGLPNAGKSTLFNLLTKRQVPAENFPFCTIDPNVGTVEVPDERLSFLAKLSQSEKIIPTAIEFKDIAGLVKNASSGAGLGNQFLSHIKEADMILLVLRAFENDDIIHVENRINPKEDMEILLLELTLSDSKLIEKNIQNLERDAKKNSALAKEKLEIANKIKEQLDEGKLASTIVLAEKNTDKEILIWRKSLNLLTDKPMMVCANVVDGGKNIEIEADIYIDILQELELSELSPEERFEFVGDKEPGLNQLIVSCFKKLNLRSYFTSGPKESRAWTFTDGMTAPKAASVIHTDFEKNFIRGEIIKYQDLVEAGDFKKAKESGKVQLIGKDYLVQDGDICEWILK